MSKTVIPFVPTPIDLVHKDIPEAPPVTLDPEPTEEQLSAEREKKRIADYEAKRKKYLEDKASLPGRSATLLGQPDRSLTGGIPDTGAGSILTGSV